MEKKKIILVGMPDMASVCLNKLVAEGFNIAGFVPPHKSNPSYTMMINFANSLGIEVFDFENSTNEPEFIERIGALNADIGVICSYDKLLSGEFLKTAKMGYINCHPSLLPEYRGGNPYHHIILNGEKKTGATIHFADETFDTGNIIFQKEIDVKPNETMGTLFNSTNHLFAQALVDVLRNYEKTGEIPSTPQPEGEFKEAPKVVGDIILNFDEPIERIERLIRSCNPFFCCNTYFRATTFRIISADYKVEHHKNPTGQLVAHDSKLAITSQGGYLYPRVVQLATWGIFGIDEFIKFFNPQPGEKIGL